MPSTQTAHWELEALKREKAVWEKISHCVRPCQAKKLYFYNFINGEPIIKGFDEDCLKIVAQIEECLLVY